MLSLCRFFFFSFKATERRKKNISNGKKKKKNKCFAVYAFQYKFSNIIIAIILHRHRVFCRSSLHFNPKTIPKHFLLLLLFLSLSTRRVFFLLQNVLFPFWFYSALPDTSYEETLYILLAREWEYKKLYNIKPLNVVHAMPFSTFRTHYIIYVGYTVPSL